MPSQKKRPVTLSSADREFLERLTTTGVHPASMGGFPLSEDIVNTGS